MVRNFLLQHYPKDASGKLQYDHKFIEELDTKTADVLRNMCNPQHNPLIKIRRWSSSTSVCFASSLYITTPLSP